MFLFPFEELLPELRTLTISDHCDFLTKLCLSHTCKKYCDLISPLWIYSDPSTRFRKALMDCGAAGSFYMIEYILGIQPAKLITKRNSARSIIKGAILNGQIEFLIRFSQFEPFSDVSVSKLIAGEPSISISNFNLETEDLSAIAGLAGDEAIFHWFDYQNIDLDRIKLCFGAAYGGHFEVLEEQLYYRGTLNSTQLANIVVGAIRGGRFDVLTWLIESKFLRLGSNGEGSSDGIDHSFVMKSVSDIPDASLGYLKYLESKSIVLESSKLLQVIANSLLEANHTYALFRYLEDKYKLFSVPNLDENFEVLFGMNILTKFKGFISLLNALEYPKLDPARIYRSIFLSVSQNKYGLEPRSQRDVNRDLMLEPKNLFIAKRPDNGGPETCIVLELLNFLSNHGYAPPNALFSMSDPCIQETEKSLFLGDDKYFLWLEVVNTMKEGGIFVESTTEVIEG